jgi:hypothetical protein
LRRLLILAVAGLATLFTAQSAEATGFDPDEMAFPVGGSDYRIIDNFGVCRDGCIRSHEGVDIMADKGVPVYAVGDGVAHWVSKTQAECCRLQIDHGDGWATRYIHLNNDTQNPDGTYTDDDQGWGIADGITDGTPIRKGQLIGWVGDSGNAKGGAPHLHFELRKYSGSIWTSTPIDAYPYLLKAEGKTVWQFLDTGHSVHGENIEKIFAAGITRGCNPPTNNRFCPDSDITRGEMAAFIVRTLGLTERSGSVPYNDIAGNTFEGDIGKLHAAGIAFGCREDSYCPNQALLREEMAEMLVRAFGYDNPEGTDFFTDDNDSRFHESINKLAAHRVTLGCNPPENTRFCPYSSLTRAEMASFFVRAEGL